MDKNTTQSGKKSGLTELIQPEDFSKTLESAMHVFQYGHHDRIPDLMQDTGKLLMKVSKRMTTTQLVVTVAAIAIGVIFAVKKAEEVIEEAIEE